MFAGGDDALEPECDDFGAAFERDCAAEAAQNQAYLHSQSSMDAQMNMVQLPLPSIQQSHVDPVTYPNHVYQQQEEIGGGYYSQEQTQSVQYVGFSQPQPTVHYKQVYQQHSSGQQPTVVYMTSRQTQARQQQPQRVYVPRSSSGSGTGQQVVYVQRVVVPAVTQPRMVTSTSMQNQSDRQQVRIVTRNHMIPESVSTGNQQNQGSHLMQQGQTQQSVAYSMIDHADYTIPTHQQSAIASTSQISSFGNHDTFEGPSTNGRTVYQLSSRTFVSQQRRESTPLSSHGQERVSRLETPISQSQSLLTTSQSASSHIESQRVVPAPPFIPLKPPPLPIPKKKKPEAIAVVATDGAQAAAAQRIGTEAGWKQMNAWLKAADKEAKVSHMKDLLRQCLQAKISVDLLLSNDTPKFVRKLSKSHEDPDVRKTASLCVSKWKKEVANPEPPPPKKEKKKDNEKENSEMDHLEMDESNKSKTTDKPKKEEIKSEKDGKKIEKRRSTDSEESKDHPAEKKGNKARARVYTAKSRLTGLEGDPDDAKPPEVKKRKEDSSSSAYKTTPTTSKALTKKITPKKTNVILSSGFMDALAGSVEPKKKLVVRKRLPSLDSKPKEPVCDPSTTPLVLDGLFSDQTRIQPETRRTPSPQSVAAVSPPLANVEVEEPEMIPAGKRRIRFADELGKELVMIKEFEIEEGERINVNRMSPEDMKHHEMMMERRFMQEQSGSTEEDDETSVELGRSSSTISTNETFKDKWRLISLDDIVILVERGCNSQANLDEIERQKHAMRAFYDPNIPCEINGEPEDFDPMAARQHIPTSIPLEPLDDHGNIIPEDETSIPKSKSAMPVPEIHSSAQSEQKALPKDLQNLLDGLKRKGIVGGGPTSSISALIPSFSGITPQVSAATTQLPAIPQIPIRAASNAYHQQIPTYQQLPTASLHGSIPSSASIQLVSGMDVHAPAMPMMNSQRPPNRYNQHKQCQFFKSPRGCHFGVRCKFAHGDQPPISTFCNRGGLLSRGGPRGPFRGRPGFMDGRNRYGDRLRMDPDSYSLPREDDCMQSPSEPMDTSNITSGAPVTIPFDPPMDTSQTPASP